MARFARINDSGKVIAFFNSEVSEIPADTFEISETDWMRCLEAGNRATWVKGKLIIEDLISVKVITKLVKVDLWRRATDAEIGNIADAIATLTPRQRLIWADSATFTSDSEEYIGVRAALRPMLGENRVAILLGEAPTVPSTPTSVNVSPLENL